MRDDKLTLNYIVFFVLAFAVIFGYGKLFPPSPHGAQKSDSAGESETEKPVAKSASTKVLPPPDEIMKNSLTEVVKNGEIFEVQTPLYTAVVSARSGAIKKWSLKNYSESPEENSPALGLVDENSTAPETAVSLEGAQLPAAVAFKYEGEKRLEVEGLAREAVFSYEKNGVRILKKMSFAPDNYLISGRYEITNNSAETVEYATHFFQRGKVAEGNYGPSDALAVSLGGEKKQFNAADDADGTLVGGVDWIGFSKKYFILAALPESGEQTEIYTRKTGGQDVETSFSYGRFSVLPGSSSVRKWKAYLGPKNENLLMRAGYGLENSIDYGWFGGLSKIAVKILKYTDRAFNNYGISIIVITLVFRLLFLPLSVRGMRSMKRMQKKMESVKPKLQAIKEKYTDDKKRQNEETMKLYSSHGINPLSSLGGCLPMLAQVPVFIALYYGLLYSIELRHSQFLWINDLSAPEELFNIPATSVPFRILPLAMGVSWWFSTKLTPMTAAGDAAAMQAKIMQFMPIVFTFVMWGFPSGLVLYWTASNVLGIAQQIYINRSSG